MTTTSPGSASSPAAATSPGSTPSSRASSTGPPRWAMSPRHPPRLGGPDPRPARRRAPIPNYLRPLDRTNTRTIDRTGGTILHTSRTNPRKMREPGLPPWLSADQRARYAIDDDRYDLTPLVLDHLDGARHRRAGDDRRRRHAVLLAGPGERGRAARRDPQDDGQRRPGHRVLHRLLDRDHAGQGADQPAADDARQPRADRRLPDLRPRRRVLGAVHRVRDLGPVRHPRGAVRPRRARRAPRRRTTARTRATTRS